MKKLALRTKVARALRGGSRGMTLIEVVVTLALLGIIAVTFLGGLTAAARAAMLADVRTTAESLARAQMEYVKSQEFSLADWDYEITAATRNRTYHTEEDSRPTWWSDDPEIPPMLDSMYHTYAVKVEAEALFDEDEKELDGIQQITVTVSHDGEVVFTLEGYKRRPWQPEDEN